MNKYTILNEGPFLSLEDLRPYITKDENCIISVVAGTQGVLKFSQRERVLVSKNGQRVASVDFSRGTPVMIVNDGKRNIVMTRTHYERMHPKEIVLVGSAS